MYSQSLVVADTQEKNVEESPYNINTAEMAVHQEKKHSPHPSETVLFPCFLRVKHPGKGEHTYPPNSLFTPLASKCSSKTIGLGEGGGYGYKTATGRWNDSVSRVCQGQYPNCDDGL